MALTQAMLKAMGIEDEKRDQIMEAHQGVLESIKAERNELKEEAAKVPDLEKQIEELKAAQPTEDWEARYNEKVTELDSYKAQVAEENAKAEKESLYKSALREVGIGERFIDDIVGVTDFSSVVVEDGELADAEAVKQNAAEKYATFITQTSTQGAKVEEPPSSVGAKMTKDEIFAIQDASARQKAIAENIDQFR